MKISIVGGSGFIGTRLCHRLEQSSSTSFIVVDKVRGSVFTSRTRIADVRSTDALRAAIVDKSVLVNLAAEHRDDVTPRSLYDDVNVQGARNLCEVARQKDITTIVFTSSVAVYGFARPGTDETGAIDPFNDYGRSKYEAEKVFTTWQAESPAERTLVILRPTVVFGERNRGNVYNLLRQIASGRFVMVGSGENRKSMAYVENVAAFLEFALTFRPGLHIYNFIDKPDFTMNSLVEMVREIMGQEDRSAFRLPLAVGYSIGKVFDAVAAVSGRKLAVSSVRVRKFAANTVFDSSIGATGFVSPVALSEALKRTVRYEFLESHAEDGLFYTE
jgi:nucleoside-diphosphate-sugar epimerase